MTATARAEAAPGRTYTITELAQEFDVTPRAIRFYEDMGLLQPARAGRNRVYTHRDRTRLKLTLRGKRLGLSLSEVKELVEMYESPADTAPQRRPSCRCCVRTACSSSASSTTSASRSRRSPSTRRAARGCSPRSACRHAAATAPRSDRPRAAA